MINGNGEIRISRQEGIEIAKKALAYLHEHAPRTRAILIRAREKVPSERDWTTKNNYPVNSEMVLRHVANGGNWGLTHPSGMSCAIDGDTPAIRAAALSLGDTMEWNTGTPGHYCEVFRIKDAPIENIPLMDGAYIRGKGGQNVGPGSIHPNGRIYGAELLHLVPPVMVTKAELLEVFRPFIVGNEKLDNAPESAHKNQHGPGSNKVEPATQEMIGDVVSDLLLMWDNGDGKRHRLTLAIIGFLERRGWTEHDIQSVMEQLTASTGKGYDHVAQVHYVYGKGQSKYGLPTIKAIAEEVGIYEH